MHKVVAILFPLFLFYSNAVSAQRTRTGAHRAAQQKVEQRMDSTYRKKGRQEVQKITYENDTRYNDPNNRVQAVIVFRDSLYKKQKLKTVTSTRLVFGKTGEAYVSRTETDKDPDKNMTWMLYNYAEKANYIVYFRDKSATKMPLINMKKMVESSARKEAERLAADSAGGLRATDVYGTFSGFKARKFIQFLRNGDSCEVWVSKDLKLSLGDNYMLGARLDSYKFPDNPAFKDMSKGMVVRTVIYNKKGEIKSIHAMSEFQKGKTEEQWFDLSGYKVMDVLSGL